ncbi:HSD2 [Acrasis kona]|uniref:HSD2 n=1 Tax=Acrasis kona TaxID=1008807 RepID=A0AAW2Z708_9EUKA
MSHPIIGDNLLSLINIRKDKENETREFYKNKVVIITGASMGIGKGLSLTLSQYGTKLALCARSADLLESLAQECKLKGAQDAIAITCDVTDQNDCKKAVEKTLQAFGGIDVLMLNAGISGSQPFQEMTDLSVFDKMMQVNFKGYVNFTFHALPHLKKSQNGRIGVMSSMSGLIGVPYRTAYCSSKYAVNGFFEVLRNELGKDSTLKITVMCPGWVDTDIRSRHVLKDNNDSQYKDKSKFMSVEDCVNGTLYAVAIGKRDERFQMLPRIIPLIKAVSAKTVDGIISKYVSGTPSKL